MRKEYTMEFEDSKRKNRHMDVLTSVYQRTNRQDIVNKANRRDIVDKTNRRNIVDKTNS